MSAQAVARLATANICGLSRNASTSLIDDRQVDEPAFVEWHRRCVERELFGAPPGLVGEADDGGADQPNQFRGEDCNVKLNKWLSEEYAPLRCNDGTFCVGRVSIETMPTCEGKPDHAC